MHRTFEIVDEEEDEDFTADNAAEEKVSKIIAIDDEAGEAVKEKEINRTNEANEADHEYLTKASLTVFSIIVFNSSNCLNVKLEAIEIEVKALLEILQSCCEDAKCGLILLKDKLRILN